MKTKMNILYLAFALFAYACVLSPMARAVTPAPDGCYAGFTTAEGCKALGLLTTGAGNTGLGWGVLQSDTTASFNTGVGAGALLLNNGDSNTALGALALLLNTSGTENTAVGTDAMVYNDTGFNNSAVGAFALSSNTTGFDNAAVGADALSQNTTGSWNVATGDLALAGNTTGAANTAVGNIALVSNGTGAGNTAIGAGALRSNTGGFDNIGVGENAGCLLTSGNNNIHIGSFGVDTESDTIRIGRVVEEANCDGFTIPAHTTTYIAGIYGATASGGTAVYINSDGQLGTLTSSARFKEDMKPMDKASEALLALKPVTFRYKDEIDPNCIPQFGLVAEDVEKVAPDLVARDREGMPYTVRYEAVNAMLLNEFLKEHRRVEQQDKELREQQATIVELKSGMQALIATVKHQVSQIQEVSAQLELQKATAQIVAHNH